MGVTTNTLNKNSPDFRVGNIFLNGNAISTLDTNGSLNIEPNGSGIISQTKSVVGGSVGFLNYNSDNTNGTSDANYRTLTEVSGGDSYFTSGINTTRAYCWGIDNSASDVLVEATASSASFVNPSSGTVLRQMTSSGIQNLPLQPAFLAYLNTTVNDVTGDGTIYTVIYDTEVFDQGNNFNLATSTFTAPVTGRYQINVGGNLIGGTSMSSIICRINTSNRVYRVVMFLNAGSTSSASAVGGVLADMDASDTFTITLQSTDTGGKVDDVAGTTGGEVRNWVSCCLVA